MQEFEQDRVGPGLGMADLGLDMADRNPMVVVRTLQYSYLAHPLGMVVAATFRSFSIKTTVFIFTQHI